MPACCHCPPPAAGPPPAVPGWTRLGFAAIVAGQSMVLGLAANVSPPAGRTRLYLHLALALAAIVVFILLGPPLLRSAWDAVRHGRPTIELLFLAGIFAAFGASLHCTITGVGHIYYEVVAILLAIYTFGRLLGARRQSGVREASLALAREFDRCERVSLNGSCRTVPAREIRPGDLIHIPAGATIAVDGVIESGCAQVGETPLTGEPFPVVRREGDRVLAGSTSLDGPLRVRAATAGDARQLDEILDRVREASTAVPRLQREADRIVAWFLPLVMGLSVVAFAFWTWRIDWTVGLFNALAVILVACPCSMGLATPVAIWSALADLAKHGVVSGSPDIVERLARVDAVVFDKTGTLGEEEMELVDFVAAPGFDRTRLLDLAASIQAASAHPIARAFRREGAIGPARNLADLPGIGVRGTVGDAEIAVGNASIASASPSAEIAYLRGMLAAFPGASHEVFIISDGRLAGMGVLREQLKSSARPVLDDLAALGYECSVLTGDNAQAAANHDLPRVTAGLSPLAKVTALREILERRGRLNVLFVGDGVNDTPALAESPVSLSIGGGSALARGVALGELVGGDLRGIPYALSRSRTAVRVIRQNLAFAAAYNFAGIALAMSGFLHPVAAALLMLVSSFTVTWRALRPTRASGSTAEARQADSSFWPLAGHPASSRP